MTTLDLIERCGIKKTDQSLDWVVDHMYTNDPYALLTDSVYLLSYPNILPYSVQLMTNNQIFATDDGCGDIITSLNFYAQVNYKLGFIHFRYFDLRLLSQNYESRNIYGIKGVNFLSINYHRG